MQFLSCRTEKALTIWFDLIWNGINTTHLAASPAEVTSVLKSTLSCHLPRACLWSPSDDISQPPKLQHLALGSRPLNFWQGFILSLSLSWGQVSLSLGPLITDPRILSGWLDYILDYTSNDCPYKMLKRIYILSGKTDSNPPDISSSPHCPTNNLAMWSLPPRFNLWNSLYFQSIATQVLSRALWKQKPSSWRSPPLRKPASSLLLLLHRCWLEATSL